MNQFSLIFECGRPIAALVPNRLKPAQVRTITRVLPAAATFDDALAKRWCVAHVLCSPDWASEQKRRVPMFPPQHSVKLCFV